MTGDTLILKCHECGNKLVILAEANQRHRVACVTCGSANDAKEVLENSAGLIRGSLTPEQVLDLCKQIRASS